VDGLDGAILNDATGLYLSFPSFFLTANSEAMGQMAVQALVKLMVLMGVIFPTVVAGLEWGDWKGVYVYTAIFRMVFVHHVGAIFPFLTATHNL
jgi:hypothetical protein